MWAEYKKRFVITQIAIVGLSLLLHFAQGYPWGAVLFAFCVLQVFGVLGTRWAMRMRKKIEAAPQMLRA